MNSTHCTFPLYVFHSNSKVQRCVNSSPKKGNPVKKAVKKRVRERLCELCEEKSKK